MKCMRQIVSFPDSENHKIKIKKSEKLDKYLDFARELKKLCNTKVTIIPIIAGTLGTILTNLEKRIVKLDFRGRIKTTKTLALLKYLEESWRAKEICYHFDISENYLLLLA